MTAMSPVMPEALGKLTLRQLLCLSLDREPTRGRAVKPADLAAMEDEESRRWRGEV